MESVEKKCFIFRCGLLYVDKCRLLLTLACERSWRMPGVTRPQKSMMVACARRYSDMDVWMAAHDSQYIVHSYGQQTTA